jgi:DNA ligase-associated metallophosphoesterase
LGEARLGIAGTEIVLDAAGALWLPESRTLVVSDLHLEKGSSFARRRVFLPPYDTGATLSALAAVVAARNPAQVICLGDSFHDNGGSERLEPDQRLRLRALQAGRHWIWVSGNHDPDLPAGLGGDIVGIVTVDGLTFRHEPAAAPVTGEVAGHLHPSAKIRRYGRSVRRRAFVTDGARLILPAFGVLAGGLNILDRAFAPLFVPERRLAFMLGDRRIFPVPVSALAPD